MTGVQTCALPIYPQLLGDHFRRLAAGKPVVNGFAFEGLIEFTADFDGCLVHVLAGSLFTQFTVRQFEAAPHWGFDALNESWKKEREQLESLLTTDELESARATTLNAHYTAPVVIRAMYAALERFGFRQGRVLEPAAGLGHFIGLMPDEMKSGCRITGIEIDSITVRLARKLYPDADLRHQPFEDKIGRAHV